MGIRCGSLGVYTIRQSTQENDTIKAPLDFSAGECTAKFEKPPSVYPLVTFNMFLSTKKNVCWYSLPFTNMTSRPRGSLRSSPWDPWDLRTICPQVEKSTLFTTSPCPSCGAFRTCCGRTELRLERSWSTIRSAECWSGNKSNNQWLANPSKINDWQWMLNNKQQLYS